MILLLYVQMEFSINISKTKFFDMNNVLVQD